MNTIKHTPEPWAVVINYNDKSTFAIENPQNLRSAYIADDIEEANAARIVECVNAMAGIENPSAWVEQVNQNWRIADDLAANAANLLKERDALFEALWFCRSVIQNQGMFDMSERMAVDKANKAIAKVKQIQGNFSGEDQG